MLKEYQDQDIIYALDIGTRSIIGIVGFAEEERFRVLAIEKEEHSKRTMLDGQIEDIHQVAKAVRALTDRLEARLHLNLHQVCIAAAGRALHTENGHFEIKMPSNRRINHDVISELEAGAVANAEANLSETLGTSGFYLVGYSVSRYLLDRYPMSTLLEHSGQLLEAEVVATFLPGEVVESLYSAMRFAELEVSSLTLEPIAALNAVIPSQLRLLNLVLADIGAGTTDIAVCREGSVVGYTMATVAGDEISESIMKALLVDFPTAERLKAGFNAAGTQHFTNILGLEQAITAEELLAIVTPSVKALSQELSSRVLEVNSAVPSALFLSGGGSKLFGLQDMVAESLEIERNRVAVAGNNFQSSATSENHAIDDPEYATPLGIAISASLGLINDSYRVTLNGAPAKLFRSGTLSALDILMMNGYTYADLIGRGGQTLSVTIDGTRTLFWGEPAVPSVLKVNGVEVPPSTVIHTGDTISFTPAVPGVSAQKTFADAVGGPELAAAALLNGNPAPPHQLLLPGDVILRDQIFPSGEETDGLPEEIPEDQTESLPLKAESGIAPPAGIHLNGTALKLAPKQDGDAYYLMDLLEYSGIDFANLNQDVTLQVNGANAPFTYVLQPHDSITIELVDPS